MARFNMSADIANFNRAQSAKSYRCSVCGQGHPGPDPGSVSPGTYSITAHVGVCPTMFPAPLISQHDLTGAAIKMARLPLTVTPEQYADLGERVRALAGGDHDEPVVCPDCNGTKVYVGLNETRPCPTCQGDR